MEVRNFLAEARRRRGLGASELAALVGVTRQTIYAMETGAYVPNTAVALRLARVFGMTVEELFRIEDDEEPASHTTEVELLAGEQPLQPGQPVQVCRVGKRLVAVSPEPLRWNLPLADGVLAAARRTQTGRRKATAQLFHSEKDLGKRLLIAGCDPGVSVLARHLQRAGIELVVAQRNSTQALDLLKEGLVHVAGCHLGGEAGAEAYLPEIRSRFPHNQAAVIGFAVWEEGLIVARENPKNIHGIEDLARPGVTIMNRETGAGCRALLDSRLKKAGIEPAQVNGYNQTAAGHLPAAWSVLTGKADCCLATRAAANVFGLEFLPLLTERYDLVIRKTELDRPEIETLLETLNRAAFRRELEGLGGYDAAPAGERMA